MTSLARAGWGELAAPEWRGVRAITRALVDVLDHRGGSGATTVAEVASTAGYSERWTRRCMAILEDLGVITWHRGGIADGSPTKSIVRIAKRALVALIIAARPVRDAAVAATRAATLERIRAARLRWIVEPREKRKRRSRHAELGASRAFSREGSAAEGPPQDYQQISSAGAAAARQAIAAARRRNTTSGAGSAGAQTMEGGPR
jgi:hypothetical protein